MAQYKKGKDKVIGMTSPAMEHSIDGQGMRLIVGVFKYADNPAKIGIQRFYMNGGEGRAAKLGRITAEEAQYIADRLPEAIKILRQSGD